MPNIPEPEEPDEEEYALDADGEKNDSRKFNEEYKKNLVLSADRLRESIIAGRMRIYSSQNQFTQAFMKNHHVYTWKSAQRK